MDGDGSGFAFPSTSDYSKGQDATDISWADIFLDGIHSDDPGATEAGGVSTNTSGLGASIRGTTQQLVQQPQTGVVGGQLQIHIPTHLQGSLTNNAVQQASTNLCGTVAYLAPSASTQQQVGTAGRIQNVMAVTGQHQMAASVGQQQHQGNAKLVQIASSFPMASVQQLQSLLQSNQTLAGQAIYGAQSAGLFPAQGSVHIENPKVVNVNFGPHVIGSDGSGQQAIFQTAEGKRVLITNSQLQHLPQSISLTQPLVGTQLINSAGGNVIRTSMAPGTHTIVPVSTTGTQQIVLPSGQTVIPRQANTQQGGITKNVVLRPLNPNMSPVIYQSGQTGQLIHSQPTLITSSGTGLQVVNAGGSQGGQVQLISQPSINQAGIGQQQLNQNTIMNLINNQGVISGAGNQITGLMPGQNIFVNGQMLSIGQLSSLAVPQLQVQHNPQGGVTLTNINAAQFQPATQQLVIQHNGQQQHMLLQPKSTQSAPLVVNAVSSQRLGSGMLGSKNAPTSNANSASSTPVLTPTPSTPTPTPTPDLMSDSCDSGAKSSQGINILEQALAMSAIDLQSFEDDFNFLDSADCFPSVTTPPPSATPIPQLPKQKLQPTKSRSKTSKSKSKTVQPIVNVTVNSSTMPFQQPTAQLLNAQGQKVTISPQQKVITPNGQVYVLSANGQQFILQPSASSSNAVISQLKQVASMASTAGSINKTNVSIPTSSHLQIKEFSRVVDQNSLSSSLGGQLKLSSQNIPVSVQQQNQYIQSSARLDDKIFIRASSDGTVHSVPTAQVMFTTVATNNNSPSTISQAPQSQTLSSLNEPQMLQIKNQKITTLSGTFFKQEPLEQLVKQEPVTELHQSVTHAQDLPDMGLSMTNISHTLAATTSSTIAIATPLVISSASITAVTTATTQSHQFTIMSTNQMVGSQQITLSTAANNLPHSSTLSDKSSSHSYIVSQSQSVPTILHSVTSTATTTASKSNSKEKDPANIKSMIPIKIADSTLMLSLTPGQKERLESQLSRMSKKDQEGLLIYQQNIIRRSQQVQQKQMEQQLKQKKLLQQQQEELQQQLQQPKEFRQMQQREPTQQLQQPQQQIQQMSQQQIQQLSQQQIQQLSQQQIQQLSQQQIHPLQHSFQPQQSPQQTHSSVIKSNDPVQIINRSELLSPQAKHASFPTTVQELLEKPEQHDVQQKFQSLSTITQQAQSIQLHQAQQQHQSMLQQHQIHSNLQQRVPPLDHSGDSIQQMLIPQLGRCLAEQQLQRDRSLALSPDVSTPFKNFSDAMRRLVRYHTLQDHKPEEDSKTMKTWDTRYSKLCDYLVKKKRCYVKRFSKMQLYRDMCQHKRPEHIQNLMCFNEQLRELIDNEKERAKNHPDLFEPINPDHLSFNHCVTTSVSSESDSLLLSDSEGKDETDPVQLKYFTVKEDPDSGSEKTDSSNASPSKKKRKLLDKGSSGTLKLVLKRRTTDNFIVKKSLETVSELFKDLKPSMNLEKSDSEYEFDSQTTDVACNQPVLVRRRTLSVASQQTSSDTSSDNGSFISQPDKIQDHSSMEEDLEEERDENNEADDDEEVMKSSDNDDEVEDSDVDDSCSVSADAFMEPEEMVFDSKDLDSYKMGMTDVSDQSLFRYAERHGTHHERIRKKSSHLSSNNDSVTSGNVFHSNLSYPLTDSPSVKSRREYDNICLDETRIDQSFAFQSSTVGASNSFSQNCTASSPTHEEEYSVSNMEKEAARKGLPSSALFTTPNKNLLETDAMFISDDEEEVRGGRRVVSSFEIDNKDPQSSMINESVRSAINSVLDGDDDDDNEDSQASWASAAHRPSSSSSVHRNLFHSSSVPCVHDADLDAAVQSILN